jgi:Mg-chelatase subunit ChlD
VNTAIVPGSIKSVADRDGISLAESFLSAELIILVDVSGSMTACDSRGGRSRYDVACEELRKLQERNAGRIAVVGFSDTVAFCPGGLPTAPSGGTLLARALQFVQVADGTVRFVIISDGQPFDEQQAIDVARQFTSQIDCIHVGAEDDLAAIRLLQRIAKSRGGHYATAARAQELASTVETLMLKAG